ncbi:MAG: SufD family Fe-S cluster assembly protein [Dehalococcoidia bacterium]|nr:MAG: SufD family Fe-S cluster assembly protein [Dehalococcoidia bacterium]
MITTKEEYEEIVEAYGKAGGNKEALKSREVASLVIHESRVLSANQAEGIRVKWEQKDKGVRVELTVEEGKKITYPVHLCFGVLPKEGLQEIILRVEAQADSEVNVIAHCIFPNAVNVIHKMDADIKIGNNAKFYYHETHYHGEFGGVKVIPKAKIRVGKKGVWESTFSLIDGCVGTLDYDFEIFGEEKSISELIVKVYGKKEDDIKITEKIHLDGKEARGLAKSRLVLNDNAKAIVRGETYGNAPLARGHVDCVEIVNGEGVIARAIPVVYVNDKQAKVTHEAAIGSIDKKQMQTLMARGLDEEEAVKIIVKGILR